MTGSEPTLVRNDDADAWGVYYPEANRIEAAVGDEIQEIHGDYLGVNWHHAEQEDLRASIEADIETVRKDIEELRECELTEEQEQELARVELKLESHETVLEIAREVDT